MIININYNNLNQILTLYLEPKNMEFILSFSDLLSFSLAQSCLLDPLKTYGSGSLGCSDCSKCHQSYTSGSNLMEDLNFFSQTSSSYLRIGLISNQYPLVDL